MRARSRRVSTRFSDARFSFASRRGNQIGVAGVQALAPELRHTAITNLNLAYARALASGLDAAL